VDAAHLRLGDEVLTPDGWQTITGIMIFKDSGQVSAFTDERDPEHSDGWQFDVTAPMKIRRTGQVGEPTLNRLAKPILTAPGHCVRCGDTRAITGVRIVSRTGVIRVRGRCQTCDKGGQKGFVGLTAWAEDAR
jgi:hypothetical protein